MRKVFSRYKIYAFVFVVNIVSITLSVLQKDFKMVVYSILNALLLWLAFRLFHSFDRKEKLIVDLIESLDKAHEINHKIVNEIVDFMQKSNKNRDNRVEISFKDINREDLPN